MIYSLEKKSSKKQLVINLIFFIIVFLMLVANVLASFLVFNKSNFYFPLVIIVLSLFVITFLVFIWIVYPIKDRWIEYQIQDGTISKIYKGKIAISCDFKNVVKVKTIYNKSNIIFIKIEGKDVNMKIRKLDHRGLETILNLINEAKK